MESYEIDIEKIYAVIYSILFKKALFQQHCICCGKWSFQSQNAGQSADESKMSIMKPYEIDIEKNRYVDDSTDGVIKVQLECNICVQISSQG